MENNNTVTLQARCGRGRGPCRINFQFPASTQQVPVYYACAFADCGKHEHLGSYDSEHYGVKFIYQGESPIKDAAPYMLRCVAHKDMMHFRKLSTARSTAPCSEDCTQAEGDKCKCSCNGLFHGIDA